MRKLGKLLLLIENISNGPFIDDCIYFFSTGSSDEGETAISGAVGSTGEVTEGPEMEDCVRSSSGNSNSSNYHLSKGSTFDFPQIMDMQSHDRNEDTKSGDFWERMADHKEFRSRDSYISDYRKCSLSLI